MENPFCYVPFIAKKLKGMDKSTNEYRKLLKTLHNDPTFYTRLTEKVLEDEQNASISDGRDAFINDTRMALFFVKIAVIGILAATAIEIFFRRTDIGGLAMYLYAAAFCTVPFVVGYLSAAKKYMYKMSEMYLESYRLPDKRFSEQRIQELVLVKSSADVIHINELGNDIPCGCYRCMSIFGSSELRITEETEEYVCPNCGRPTVVSERCGHEITEELLQDLHDYWIGEQDSK